MKLNIIPFDWLTKRFAKTFYEYINDIESFTKNYNLLLQGLTEEQKDFLLRIFTRMFVPFHDIVSSHKVYTQEEINEQIKVIKREENIVKPIGNYFKYDNKYILPRDAFECSVFYYRLGMNYFKNLQALHNKDFLDIGAFCGDSALILNEYNPSKIYSFEPVTENYEHLLITIILNNLENTVIPQKLGLGSTKKSVNIAVHNSGSTVDPKNAADDSIPEQIQIDTLDNFVMENNLNVGLIKIDTEGMELDILKGSIETIKKFKPALLLSIYHNAEQFFETKPMIESLDLGYKFDFVKLNPFSIIYETMLICEVY